MTTETIKQILQVEDNQDTAGVLAIFLRQAGYQVETVSTCQEAVEAIREQRFDLYLFDNLLPDGTGIAQRYGQRDGSFAEFIGWSNFGKDRIRCRLSL